MDSDDVSKVRDHLDSISRLRGWVPGVAAKALQDAFEDERKRSVRAENVLREIIDDSHDVIAVERAKACLGLGIVAEDLHAHLPVVTMPAEWLSPKATEAQKAAVVAVRAAMLP